MKESGVSAKVTKKNRIFIYYIYYILYTYTHTYHTYITHLHTLRYIVFHLPTHKVQLLSY